jgi:hypothetical protein
MITKFDPEIHSQGQSNMQFNPGTEYDKNHFPWQHKSPDKKPWKLKKSFN